MINVASRGKKKGEFISCSYKHQVISMWMNNKVNQMGHEIVKSPPMKMTTFIDNKISPSLHRLWNFIPLPKRNFKIETKSLYECSKSNNKINSMDVKYCCKTTTCKHKLVTNKRQSIVNNNDTPHQ